MNDVWDMNLYRTKQPVSLTGDHSRALGGRGRRDTFGGAAMGALQGLRSLGTVRLPKRTEKTVAAARELNAFLQGFIEQVGARDEDGERTEKNKLGSTS